MGGFTQVMSKLSELKGRLNYATPRRLILESLVVGDVKYSRSD